MSVPFAAVAQGFRVTPGVFAFFCPYPPGERATDRQTDRTTVRLTVVVPYGKAPKGLSYLSPIHRSTNHLSIGVQKPFFAAGPPFPMGQGEIRAGNTCSSPSRRPVEQAAIKGFCTPL